jgi:hypothetical protein
MERAGGLTGQRVVSDAPEPSKGAPKVKMPPSPAPNQKPGALGAADVGVPAANTKKDVEIKAKKLPSRIIRLPTLVSRFLCRPLRICCSSPRQA